MANCWAMGRSSEDATKACLIFAVLADHAALPVRLIDFLPFAAGLAFVLVDFAGVLAVIGFDLAEAGGLPDGAEELPELCAETGSRAMSVESTPARQRVKSGAGVGEFAALMLPL